jgi:hypothetical protein
MIVFWGHTPCRIMSFSIVSEEYAAIFFRVSEVGCCFGQPEDGVNMFL